MKRLYFLAAAAIALLCSSCQKENLNSRVLGNLGDKLSPASPTQTPKPLPETKGVHFGALISAPGIDGSLDFQQNVAGQLGISYLRSRVNVPSTGSVEVLNTTYHVLLNFNSDFEGKPLPFVTNLTQYKTDLNNILDGFTNMPVVAVIENEESNTLYYSGTAEEYISQLNAAVEVMHAHNIRVANGGITDAGLNYLVYQDFINQGKEDSAEQFKQSTRLTPRNSSTQARGAFVNTLLQAYASMDLDYVNFHWKATSPDVLAFSEVIAYLKRVTGKTIITNELGQFDKDPNTLITHLQKCNDEAFPYIMWYSPDENDGKKATSLQHSDASLTDCGVAYKNYLDN